MWGTCFSCHVIPAHYAFDLDLNSCFVLVHNVLSNFHFFLKKNFVSSTLSASRRGMFNVSIVARVTQHRCKWCSTDSDVRTGDPCLAETNLKAANTSSTSTSTYSLSASRCGMFNLWIVARVTQHRWRCPHWLRRQNCRPGPETDLKAASTYLRWKVHLGTYYMSDIQFWFNLYNIIIRITFKLLIWWGGMYEDCVTKICKVNDDLFHRLQMFNRCPSSL